MKVCLSLSQFPMIKLSLSGYTIYHSQSFANVGNMCCLIRVKELLSKRIYFLITYNAFQIIINKNVDKKIISKFENKISCGRDRQLFANG